MSFHNEIATNGTIVKLYNPADAFTCRISITAAQLTFEPDNQNSFAENKVRKKIGTILRRIFISQEKMAMAAQGLERGSDRCHDVNRGQSDKRNQ
ncbi:hypothetical protein TUM12370_32700 [Salmonella enterica subsp. enterica serovar Choleraesuis]|nr:hypothetical protein TUM12370_32700 [Salmonella enterica subsp. enterica serovar Choleraesuis]